MGLITDVKQHFQFVDSVIEYDVQIGDYGYNLIETKRYMVLSGALLNKISIRSELQNGFIKTDYPVQNIGFQLREDGCITLK